MIPDIYHYDKIVDVNDFIKNIDFVVLKATEGQTFVDSKIFDRIKLCEKYNIPYWVYCFLRNGNEKAQAKFMVDTVKKHIGKNFVGYVLDAECKNKNENIEDAMKWLRTLNVKSMLYYMYADYNMYFDLYMYRDNKTGIWEARYGLNNGKYSSKYPPHKKVDLHQYTDAGRCPGLSGDVDLNRVYARQLSWFTTPYTKSGYSGKFPVLPPRGYYNIGDGYETLTEYNTQVKRVQYLLNWAIGSKLTIDGKYGEKTSEAVKKLQEKAKTDKNGKFGNVCLAYARKIKK